MTKHLYPVTQSIRVSNKENMGFGHRVVLGLNSGL